MWIDKLADGVVRVMTPLGPRYLQPSFLERLYLIWVFRHFRSLPHQVLNRHQQRLIDSLFAYRNFVAWGRNGSGELPVIGTIERRPPVVDIESGTYGGSENETNMVGLVADLRQRW
jgi:hypothetical protein